MKTDRMEELQFSIELTVETAKRHLEDIGLLSQDNSMENTLRVLVSDPGATATILFSVHFYADNNVDIQMESLNRMLEDPQIHASIRASGTFGRVIAKITNPDLQPA